ncbi:hypothetical protein ACLK2B_04905 [Escherichia coli]
MSPSRHAEPFKHLISEATNYVAADYMRHANERRVHLDKALEFRRELHTSRQQLAAEQYKHVDMARELAKHNGAEGDLEADYQAASDHLNPVPALRQQEKIERYEADLDELQDPSASNGGGRSDRTPGRERGSRGSCLLRSGRAEKPAC